MSRICVIDDTVVDEGIMKKDGLVIVLFWATWCCHCTSCVPIFEELSDEMVDVTFVTVNKYDGVETARKFEISSIPVILFLKNGEVKENHLGGMGKEYLRSKINYLLLK